MTQPSREGAGARKPCTCGERETRERERDDARALVNKLDASCERVSVRAERLQDDLDAAREEVQQRIEEREEERGRTAVAEADLASAIRERDEARAELEKLRADHEAMCSEVGRAVARDLVVISLRAREKALREALDVIAGHVPMVGSDAEADLACTVDMLRAYARDILDGKL